MYKTEGKNKPEPVKVALELVTCHSSDGSSFGQGLGCPFVREESTPGAGCASDYYCGHPLILSFGKKYMMKYVEYSSDHNPVPDWCPIRIKE